MYVCFCRRVTDRCVQAAIAAGARDPETLALSSRAGTGCGGCWSTVEAMLVAAGVERVDETVESSPAEKQECSSSLSFDSG